MLATVLLPAPGGPATTHADAGTLITSEDTADLSCPRAKADRLDEPGLAEAMEFTRRVLDEAGHAGQVYPMSARAALDGRDPGFAAFRADFTAYLSSRRKADLRASAVAQARRIAGSLLDEVRLTRRSAEMAVADAWRRQRQEIIEEGLADVDARLAGDLKAELDVLRDSAAELLRLDLAVPEPGGRLTEKTAVLLHHPRGCRADRAAGRCRPPLAPRRARQAHGQGAPAPGSAQPGRQPDRPGPGGPAVPARGGDPGADRSGRAALCRRHRADAGRAADGGRPARGLGRRGCSQGRGAIRPGSGAASRIWLAGPVTQRPQ